MIQQELINSVKGKVANTPRGKELLDKQLKNIREKKNKIIEEANKETELFKKFQIATQANPNLTEEQLDEKIIHSAINFWFEDEDAGSGKVWNYFKGI